MSEPINDFTDKDIEPNDRDTALTLKLDFEAATTVAASISVGLLLAVRDAVNEGRTELPLTINGPLEPQTRRSLDVALTSIAQTIASALPRDKTAIQRACNRLDIHREKEDPDHEGRG
jgi:hypothetical protein